MGRGISFEEAGNVHRSVKRVFAYDAFGDSTFIREVWVYDADGNPVQIHPQLLQYPVGIAQSLGTAITLEADRLHTKGDITAGAGGEGYSLGLYGTMTNKTFSFLGSTWTITRASLSTLLGQRQFTLQIEPTGAGSPGQNGVFGRLRIDGEFGYSEKYLILRPNEAVSFQWVNASYHRWTWNVGSLAAFVPSTPYPYLLSKP